MKNEAYLGLDLGGTGAKAGVFDRAGAMLGFGHRSYAPDINDAGHAEIPIDVIYTTARAAVREAVGRNRARVVAMSVSSQGQTFVSLDGRDRPLHGAILWYDSRASRQSESLKKAVRKLGVAAPFIETICAAAKIVWLKEEHPKVMRRARRYLLLPDYISYRLTGRAAMDPSTGTTTGWYADGAAGPCPAALDAAGIADDQVAAIVPSGQPIDRLTATAAQEWGLSADTLLVSGTNDQFAGALGAGNCRPGILSETTGTCLALVTLTKSLPSPCPPGLLGGRFVVEPWRYALAYSKTAGVVLDWFRREFGSDLSLAELDKLAAAVPIGARGVTMLPHFDGMVSPVPNPAVRGVFANLTLQHTKADLYRAILESLTFSLRENIDFLRACGMKIGVVRSIGGGAKNDLWLQMKADVTGLPIEKPKITEAAVMGAAMLAAVGHGDFRSLQESSESLYRKACVFKPDRSSRRAYSEAYERYRELEGNVRHPTAVASGSFRRGY